ncbi:2-dehydropantoate 2-reductase [Legionella busanensis]|uniref:2-dehydropantoate 2-reductase n=1 Tax=Legionella busanensis TaxID=190655 RepID=A0A378JKQ4_9GAMM|nr:2-dehydropantoate 2-reductase [Legionella busanensis]STX51311.1 2-dehydropantoate 2-reductase [Legionella busanensis]
MISVTVIGSGAIGKFYGGLFSLAGSYVCYLEQSDFSIVQDQKYYEIELPSGSVKQVKPHQIEKDYKLLPKADIIIIALKTTENHLLKKFLPPTLKPNSKLLILQNGIGNEEYLSTFINTQTIICGVTTIGAIRVKPGYVKITHLGELNLAPFKSHDFSSCEYIKQQLATVNLSNGLFPQIHLFENHRIIRWSKLLWNTPFSSLSLLLNVSVDVIATQKKYQDIARAIMYEVCLAAKKDGALIENKIEKLIAVTATLKGYYPSMYYDFKISRPIESQYIIFNVLDYAQLHQINLPVLSVIHKQLKSLEKTKEWLNKEEKNKLISILKLLIDDKSKSIDAN